MPLVPIKLKRSCPKNIPSVNEGSTVCQKLTDNQVRLTNWR